MPWYSQFRFEIGLTTAICFSTHNFGLNCTYSFTLHQYWQVSSRAVHRRITPEPSAGKHDGVSVFNCSRQKFVTDDDARKKYSRAPPNINAVPVMTDPNLLWQFFCLLALWFSLYRDINIWVYKYMFIWLYILRIDQDIKHAHHLAMNAFSNLS